MRVRPEGDGTERLDEPIYLKGAKEYPLRVFLSPGRRGCFPSKAPFCFYGFQRTREFAWLGAFCQDTSGEFHSTLTTSGGSRNTAGNSGTASRAARPHHAIGAPKLIPGSANETWTATKNVPAAAGFALVAQRLSALPCQGRDRGSESLHPDSLPENISCRDGGTGRCSGSRSRRPYGHAGSNPARGTYSGAFSKWQAAGLSTPQQRFVPLCAISGNAILCSRSSILDRAPPREGGGLPVRARPGALAANVFEEKGGIRKDCDMETVVELAQ